MSKNNSKTNIQNSYFKNNRIRSKLLLFIDNEILFKIKQHNNSLKFKCEKETLVRISFEETYTQKITNKYALTSLNILKTKKIDNSNKYFSTIDNSPNKINKKYNQRKRNNIHLKIFSNEDNGSNKSLNNIINFNKKNYSIKNVLRQSRTFLILRKQKKAAEFLKNLCNNLKICKIRKKPAKHNASSIIKNKLFNLKKNKKSPKKQNEIKFKKSEKDNKYTNSLFIKSQRKNLIFNSVTKFPVNSIFIK